VVDDETSRDAAICDGCNRLLDRSAAEVRLAAAAAFEQGTLQSQSVADFQILVQWAYRCRGFQPAARRIKQFWQRRPAR